MNRAKALKIFGLPASATEEEIKKAYRKKAMEVHPDRNQGNKESEEKFKELSLAYETLTKEAKPSIEEMEDMMDDLHFKFFGSRKRSQSFPTKPPPYTNIVDFGPIRLGNVNITLINFLFQEPVNISFKIKSVCVSCMEDKKSWHGCGNCGQTGVIIERSGNDRFMLEQAVRCPACQGLGWKRALHCRACQDRLFIVKEKKLNVTVPPNLNLNHSIKISNQGNENWNVPTGDVYFDPKVRIPTSTDNLSEEEKSLLKSILSKM